MFKMLDDAIGPFVSFEAWIDRMCHLKVIYRILVVLDVLINRASVVIQIRVFSGHPFFLKISEIDFRQEIKSYSAFVGLDGVMELIEPSVIHEVVGHVSVAHDVP